MATPYEIIKGYILDDVKRPDLAVADDTGLSEIDRRIQRALLKYHRKDNWKADLIEQKYVFAIEQSAVPTTIVTGAESLFMNQFGSIANGVFIQQVNIRFLTRYRQTQYLRKWATVNAFGSAILDPASGTQGTVANGDFTERSPDRMFDGYGGDINDVMYRSGDFINLRSSTPLNEVYIGYFSDPLLTPITSISSWIAEKYPSLISAEVSARIFKITGKDQESKDATMDVAAELLILEQNNVRLALA